MLFRSVFHFLIFDLTNVRDWGWLLDDQLFDFINSTVELFASIILGVLEISIWTCLGSCAVPHYLN